MRAKASLYDTEGSMRLLNYCLDNQIGILGIEGFIKVNDGFMPEMDCIVDFSQLLLDDKKAL